MCQNFHLPCSSSLRGENLREPPTCTTHTLSHAHSTHVQSHVHLDLSGSSRTTRTLTTLEMTGPQGSISAHHLTEEKHDTRVLLHQSAAVVTHTPVHHYTNAHLANTALSNHASIVSSSQFASAISTANAPTTSFTSLNAPGNNYVTSSSLVGGVPSISHNIHETSLYSQDDIVASPRVLTSFSTSPSPIYQTHASITDNPITVSSTTSVSSHMSSPFMNYSQSHTTNVSRSGMSVDSSTNSYVNPTGSVSVTNHSYINQQTNVPSHFVSNSKDSSQVNQLGTSSSRPPSEMASPISQDLVTEALLAVGVLAAVPSVIEPRPPTGPRVTFHLPPRHMNIPPDSSSENGNGNENVRVDVDDESSGSSLIVRCRNPGCDKIAETEESKQTFKLCHNCSTQYCSRLCRRQHWERHRKQCKKIQALAVAKQVTARVRDDERVLVRLSTVARRGVRALGRGTVKIFFHDIKGAETFIEGGEVPEAHYLTVQNLLPQETGPEVYKQILEMCRQYNTDYKFILFVSICIMNEIPSGSSPKWEREVVSRCAKLRLSSGGRSAETWTPHPEKHIITRDMDEPETLILTSLPISDSNTSPQTARHIAFTNIVRHLRERGISLKHQYPDVHRKLTAYVEGGEVFPPLTIYPRDPNSGSTFMCIIMPETDHAKLQLLGSDASKVRTIDISKPPPPP
ncbi:hypothetical protein SK128_005679 [Halocaridina rubra]|uniref:Apical junction molecule ajm1 alpha/beta domain-containing protein n=1 Tax=Halocaridina rubra TaxID=373956 RepID=A0AAN9A7V2_HALRR